MPSINQPQDAWTATSATGRRLSASTAMTQEIPRLRRRVRPNTWTCGEDSDEDSSGVAAFTRPIIRRTAGAQALTGKFKGRRRRSSQDRDTGMGIDYNGLVTKSTIDIFDRPSSHGDASPADGEEAQTVACVARQLRSNFLFQSFDDEELSHFASQFEACEFPEGGVIIEQGPVKDGEKMYYYVLVEGECNIVKDGKALPGKYGTLGPGSSFGEKAILYDERIREATIVASRASAESGKVLLCRLDGAIVKGEMDKEEVAQLQDRMRDVMKVFDVLSGIDVKIKKKGTIIRPYRPSSLFLTFQWTGTIFQYVWKKTLLLMVATAILGMLLETFGSGGVGNGLDSEYEYYLDLVAGWWITLQPLASFVATFFLSEAFSFWKRFYVVTRSIQGRMNDVCLLSASIAARGHDGKITRQAKHAQEDIARLLRLLHQLYWSAVVTRFNVLHSPEGLSILHSFSLVTDQEYEALVKVSAKDLGGHHAAMTWLTTRIVLARKNGEIEDDYAAMQVILEKLTLLRALMADIPDMYDGRMPMAYVHFVHILVNTLTVLSPIALFPSYQYWSIPAVGIISIFYLGILTLSLMFLDPVDNDEKHGKYDETCGFDVGVLIRESNSGSLRWEGCALALPEEYDVDRSGMSHPKKRRTSVRTGFGAQFMYEKNQDEDVGRRRATRLTTFLQNKK